MTENMLPAHNATDPKCKCCKAVIEFNSPGYRFGLCTTCSQAVDSFLITRQTQLRRRGLIK